MINWFFKYKTNELEDCQINVNDIHRSSSILFCLFTRYGDTIIDLVVIKEFIEKFPDKDYLIICPKQMKPYVNEIIPEINSIAINKRNFFELSKLILKLKKWSPDIGFNPWSTGHESSYFLSFCKKFKLYKNFKIPEVINHYQVVRKYLNLKEKKWKIFEKSVELSYKKILICPESTDPKRSISLELLEKILDKIQLDFNNPKITIASMSIEYLRDDTVSFLFKKNEKSSSSFIKLIKESDLIFCVDSAPLHIASALKKDVVPFFYSTRPEVVLNTGDIFHLYKDV
tara:strand:+ start:1652 stop:2509 length:858 start_codon:yes stop_codon:yes gene_type:complete